MTSLGDAPQRAAAMTHLLHARGHYQKGKVERAIEEAGLAIEADPTYDEARYFLAEVYEHLGETRKAVHQLEALLFRHKNDEQLLARIAHLDPVTAEKHRRLASIAPDPFVAKGTIDSDEFIEFEEDLEEQSSPESAVPLSVATRSAAEEEVFLDEDIDESAESTSATVTVSRAHEDDILVEDEDVVEAPTGLAPEQYEYDDERKFRRNVMALEALQPLRREHRRLWAGDELEDLLRKCPPLTQTINADAYEAFKHAAARLGASATLPHVRNVPSLWPLICGPLCAYVIVPMGALEVLNGPELRFLAGRIFARITCEHVPLLDIAEAVLPHSQPGSELRQILRRTATALFGGPEALGDKETVAKVQKTLHAWRLRAELTADRGGLVCCENVGSALSAIAKLSALDASAAAQLSPETFKQKFEGQDLKRISSLGLDRDPETSEPYAFYRMLMISWWSKQPAYAQLRTTS
ncbi:MAG: tetratricopeptide repeat protein [Candidatus Zipacnadales bacterium]